MTPLPTITAGFAFLDVKDGRDELAAALQGNEAGIPITIIGTLLWPSSADDGTSVEFTLEVDKVLLDKGLLG